MSKRMLPSDISGGKFTVMRIWYISQQKGPRRPLHEVRPRVGMVPMRGGACLPCDPRLKKKGGLSYCWTIPETKNYYS